MINDKYQDKRRIAHIKTIWQLKCRIENEKHKGHITAVNDLAKNYHELIDDLREYDKYRGYQTEIITLEIKNNRRYFLESE